MIHTRSALLLALAFTSACSLKRPSTLPPPPPPPEASAPQVTRGEQEEPLPGLPPTGIAMEVLQAGPRIAPASYRMIS